MTDWPRDPETDEERHKARVAALQLMFSEVGTNDRLRAVNEAFDDVKAMPQYLYDSLMASSRSLQSLVSSSQRMADQIIAHLNSHF